MAAPYPLPTMTVQKLMYMAPSLLNDFLKRLRHEWRNLEPLPEGILSFSVVGESTGLEHWKATIQGSVDTPYENGVFVLDINLPQEYPFVAPKVIFKTKVFHPNISSTGEICLDILRDKYSSGLSLLGILLSILSLLSDPNTEDFLVPNAARLYKADRQKYNRKAREWTRKYAMTGDISGKTYKSSDESSDDNDDRVSRTNALLISSDEVKVQEAVGNQPSRSHRSERFNVFEPLKAKTFDNGESKNSLPIISQCFMLRGGDRQADRYPTSDFHDAIGELDFDNELQSLSIALPAEAFKLQNEEKNKSLLDALLPMVLQREGNELRKDQCYTMVVNALLARLSRRVGFKFWKEEKYKRLVEKLSAMGLETTESKFWKEERYTMLVNQLLVKRLEIKESKFLKENKHKRTVDKLMAMILKNGESRFWKEKNYQMLIGAILARVSEEVRFKFWKKEKYKRLVDKSPTMGLEIKESKFWKEGRYTVLVNQLLARRLEIKESKFWKEDKHKRLIDELMAMISQNGGLKFWKEENYQILADELLPGILEIEEVEFMREEQYEMLVDELLPGMLEIKGAEFWIEEDYQILVDELLPGILEIERSALQQENEFIMLADELLAKGLEIGGFEPREGDICAMLVAELFKLINTTPEKVGQGCVHLYSMGTFVCPEVNRCLREADDTNIRTYGSFVRLLYFYFNHLSSIEVHSVTVYRGMNLSLLMIDEYKEAAKRGTSFRWASFSSTSKCRQVAEFFGSNTLFIMQLQKIYSREKKAIDISTYSQFPEEEEVLLKAGVEFIVEKVKYDNEKKKYYIYLNVYV